MNLVFLNEPEFNSIFGICKYLTNHFDSNPQPGDPVPFKLNTVDMILVLKCIRDNLQATVFRKF